jgi:hypothetical protein
MLKWLQGAVVAVFLGLFVTGGVILFGMPAKMPAFAQFVGTIWPIFFGAVIPALIGRPITDLAKAKADELKAKAGQ